MLFPRLAFSRLWKQVPSFSSFFLLVHTNLNCANSIIGSWLQFCLHWLKSAQLTNAKKAEFGEGVQFGETQACSVCTFSRFITVQVFFATIPRFRWSFLFERPLLSFFHSHPVSLSTLDCGLDCSPQSVALWLTYSDHRSIPDASKYKDRLTRLEIQIRNCRDGKQWCQHSYKNKGIDINPIGQVRVFFKAKKKL